MNFKKHTLDNGLTIVSEINESAQSAAVGFFTRTGSRDESCDISGVSHFLEHMLFKGTEELSALEVNEAFDRTGAKFNAFTSEENTVYYAAVLPEKLEEVTDLWGQLMRPSLRDDDFNMEKNVIKQEIAMYQDLPQFDVIDECRSLHFGEHPCGNSVLGTVESIDELKAEQMREYFNNRYAPDNIVAACCGKVDFDKICKVIENQCGNWQSKKPGRELSDFTGTLSSKTKPKANLSQDHICMISPAVSAQDKRRFAASLMATITGDSTGSRYFWALVDTALAETAWMQCDTMDGTGAYFTYLKCPKENYDKVRKKVAEVLDELVEKGVTQSELDSARNKILSAVTIKCETPMGRLLNLGINWQYLGQYRRVEDDIADIKAVTVEDINSIISEYKPNKFSEFVLKAG